MDAVSSEERGMGPEVEYEGELECECPNCGNVLLVRHSAWEYPVGALNYSENYVSGGELVEGFKDIDFAFEEEIYSFDETSKIYLPESKKIITNLESGVASLLASLSSSPDLIHKISPREFEELIAHVFSRHGFSVELTKKTRDGGRDIIALKHDLGIPVKYIIECKRYAKTNPVTVEIARALYGVQMQESANKSVIATTSYFTSDAKKFVESQNTTKWHMSLKDYDDVIGWLLQTPNG
ncbi:hypothetical protein FHR99_000137 [Litorivivens lipolytica]|uniref:Restriction endonuclease type IV Mrr domain-containing protein n=1 Tax=Litorivivens lipolytica TaxID=1524264 RepID=A0A7W4Z5G3_9GAMM|nr:restriction endonuclease [Litorivivens lipolytica]MBB3045901.1 hypothetical protein [Litorivivens lipolytica]